jgi:putative ABC transport system permease protein
MSITSFLLSMEGAVSQGILWSVMTLGVYITFKILNFADMTVDGSFATGGAVSAVFVTMGFNPYLCLLFAMIAGLLCGGVTGFLNTRLKIPAILSGILTMIALYSVNIRIMGQPNIPLLGIDTIVTKITALLPGGDQTVAVLLFGFLVAAVLVGAMYWFFGTEIGCAVRATGNNEYMVRAFGVNTATTTVLALMLSNGLASLSGAMVSQSQGYADVQMGVGTIVIGLASVIIGEVLLRKRTNFAFKLIAVVIGSIVYRVIIALVLWLGLRSEDLKLLTAVVVAVALSVPALKDKFSQPSYRAETNGASGKPETAGEEEEKEGPRHA